MAFEEAGKGELSARLAQSRVALDRDLTGLAWEADVATKLKTSIRKKSGLWMAGAAVAGLALAVLPGKRRKAARPARGGVATEATKAAVPAGAVAGFITALLPVLKLIFPVVRPALMQFAGDVYTRFRQRGQPKP